MDYYLNIHHNIEELFEILIKRIPELKDYKSQLLKKKTSTETALADINLKIENVEAILTLIDKP